MDGWIYLCWVYRVEGSISSHTWAGLPSVTCFHWFALETMCGFIMYPQMAFTRRCILTLVAFARPFCKGSCSFHNCACYAEDLTAAAAAAAVPLEGQGLQAGCTTLILHNSQSPFSLLPCNLTITCWWNPILSQTISDCNSWSVEWRKVSKEEEEVIVVEGCSMLKRIVWSILPRFSDACSHRPPKCNCPMQRSFPIWFWN